MKKVLISVLALFVLPTASMASGVPQGWQDEVISLISHQQFKEAGEKIKEYCVEKKSGELCLIMASAYFEGEAKFGINSPNIIEAYKYTRLACEHGSQAGCEAYKAAIEKSKVLLELNIKAGEYVVVSAHREENVDNEKNLRDLLKSLQAITDKFGKPIIFSTHPRTRDRLEKLETVALDQKTIRFLKPLGFLDYVNLQMNAFCVVSDSGTITEESSILDFPAVTIRQAHERPEGMDEGTLIMCGLKADRVVESIDVITRQHKKEIRSFRMVPDYDTPNVSKKVLRIILSYTDYVNRTVWYKHI